jgi:hypothetical protein
VSTKTAATTTREIALDDVLPTLGCGREAEPAEAGVPARVHEHEHDEEDRDEHLEDCDERDHRRSG